MFHSQLDIKYVTYLDTVLIKSFISALKYMACTTYLHFILTILRSQLAGIHLTFQNTLEPLYPSIVFPCVRRIPERNKIRITHIISNYYVKVKSVRL
jgi:hypothetical protein